MRFASLLLASLVLAGCGGGSAAEEDGSRSPKEQFAGSCGSCHTLADAQTSGTFGPNLDELMPDKTRVLTAIAEGPGSMPGGLYEGAAADAVAGYVASAAGSDG